MPVTDATAATQKPEEHLALLLFPHIYCRPLLHPSPLTPHPPLSCRTYLTTARNALSRAGGTEISIMVDFSELALESESHSGRRLLLVDGIKSALPLAETGSNDQRHCTGEEQRRLRDVDFQYMV